MQVPNDVRRWAGDECGCRFPNIALQHLEAAQAALPEALRAMPEPMYWPKECAPLMDVVENATVAIIAAAGAIETHITLTAFFSLWWIRALSGEARGVEFSHRFTNAKGATRIRRFLEESLEDETRRTMPPLKEVHLKIGDELYGFANKLFQAIQVAPPWPHDNARWVKERRNELVHRTVSLLPLRPPYLDPITPPELVFAAVSLLEDVGREPEPLVEDAQRAWEVMLTCCRECFGSVVEKGIMGTRDRRIEEIEPIVDRILQTFCI